jgi:hypothetical protein
MLSGHARKLSMYPIPVLSNEGPAAASVMEWPLSAMRDAHAVPNLSISLADMLNGSSSVPALSIPADWATWPSCTANRSAIEIRSTVLRTTVLSQPGQSKIDSRKSEFRVCDIWTKIGSGKLMKAAGGEDKSRSKNSLTACRHVYKWSNWLILDPSLGLFGG